MKFNLCSELNNTMQFQLALNLGELQRTWNGTDAVRWYKEMYNCIHDLLNGKLWVWTTDACYQSVITCGCHMHNFAIDVPTFIPTMARESVAERLSCFQHRSKIFAATNWKKIARFVKRWLTTEDMYWYKQCIEMLAPRFGKRLNYGRDYVEY